MKLNDQTVINNKEFTVTWIYPQTGQKKVYKVEDKEGNSYIYKLVNFNQLSNIGRVAKEVELAEKVSSEVTPRIFYHEIDVIKKRFVILEELIEGKLLSDYFEECKNNEVISLTMFKKLIENLMEFWKANIVHRDLKPENIISKGNQFYILDLGIAKDLNEDLTKDSQTPYSSNYAAPEQLKNEKNIINWRTDLFVLGILLSEAYTGSHPFNIDDEEINTNIINLNYKETGNQNIDKVLKKCFTLPFKRYNKPEKILKVLEEIL